MVVFSRGVNQCKGVDWTEHNMVTYRSPPLKSGLHPMFREIFSLLRYSILAVVLGTIIVRRFRIDLVRGDGDYYGGWQAAFVAILTGRPLISVLHGYAVDYHADSTRLPLVLRFVGMARAIVVQKETAVQTLVRWGIPRDRIHFSDEGCVDVNRFLPTEHPSSYTPQVTFVGRLSEFKGPELLLMAAPLVLKRKHDVKFVFVGGGPLDAKLILFAAHLGISESVHLLGVIEDVRPVYDRSSIVTCLSPFNNYSDLVLLEAMSCGIPVIATNSGETSRMVHDHQNGILIEPGNYRQLADRILEVLDNPSLAKTLGTNSRRTVLEGYGIDRSSAEFQSLAESVLRELRLDRDGE